MLQLASKGRLGPNPTTQRPNRTGSDRIGLQSVYPKQKKIVNPYYSSSTESDTLKPYSNCHHQHLLSTPATSLRHHHHLRSPLSTVTLSLSLPHSLHNFVVHAQTQRCLSTIHFLAFPTKLIPPLLHLLNR
jgi:hypothetical protein